MTGAISVAGAVASPGAVEGTVAGGPFVLAERRIEEGRVDPVQIEILDPRVGVEAALASLHVLHGDVGDRPLSGDDAAGEAESLRVPRILSSTSKRSLPSELTMSRGARARNSGSRYLSHGRRFEDVTRQRR